MLTQTNWNYPRPNPSPLQDNKPPLLPALSPPKAPTFGYVEYYQLCEEYSHQAKQCVIGGNFSYLATTDVDSQSSTPWVVDPGATNHITNDPSTLTQI